MDRLVDHVVGVEQQLIELNATAADRPVEGRNEEFVALVDELVETAELIAALDTSRAA